MQIMKNQKHISRKDTEKINRFDPQISQVIKQTATINFVARTLKKNEQADKAYAKIFFFYSSVNFYGVNYAAKP
jgi:hypothetical protein